LKTDRLCRDLDGNQFSKKKFLTGVKSLRLSTAGSCWYPIQSIAKAKGVLRYLNQS
jgi:hypothetical protein